MAYPVYEDNGGLVANAASTTIDVPYPSTVNANDILFIQIIRWGGNDTFTTPTNWTAFGFDNDSTYSGTFFWKRATGSESGNETVTISDAGNNVAVMSRYSGCTTTGTPYEALDAGGIQSSTSLDIPSITTTDTERLAVCLFSMWNLKNEGAMTDYTQSFEEVSVPASTLMWGYEQDIATASTVSSDSASYSGAASYINVTFALLPDAGGTDVLTSTDLDTGNTVISEPTIGQIQVLTSDDIETGNTVISQATLGQIHELISQDITSGNPVISQPTLADVSGVDNLTSQDIVAGNPVISQATIAQIHDLVSQDIESQNVVISNPVLAEDADNLTSQDIATQATIITTAILGQIHQLTSQDVVTGATEISKPTTQKDPFGNILKYRLKRCATWQPSEGQKNDFWNKL